jgi:hypothetical protein
VKRTTTFSPATTSSIFFAALHCRFEPDAQARTELAGAVAMDETQEPKTA